MSSLELIETSNKFFIKKGNESISVDRETSQIQKESHLPEGSKIQCHGVLGHIRLLAGDYLVLVKEAEVVGELLPTHNIHRVSKVDLVPFILKENLTSDEKNDEEQYKSLINAVFHSDPSSYYFSHSMDLTRSLHSHFQDNNDNNVTAALNDLRHIDEQFMWNHHLAKNYINQDFHEFITPIIRGFVAIEKLNVDGHDISFMIMSRLGWKRVGTRYFTRGVDSNGFVANFVETEQIIKYKTFVKSFLQIRGSIPLMWSQKPHLSYKPKTILNEPKSGVGFRAHFDQIKKRYKKIVIVDLVNQHGSEKKLSDEYKKQVQSLNDDQIRYVEFDFHNQTKRMKFQNIEKLVNEVESDLTTFGYLWLDLKENKVKKHQQGVVRVNCIDCLDRTNVVQSVFGRIFLMKQLQELQVVPSSTVLSDKPKLETLFKNTWADNGDNLSKIYSGTGALKGDFTRTGKRSMRGLWNDFCNSATRYYLNNFTDGKRQDALNLLLGKYEIDRNEPSPFQQKSTTQKIYRYLLLLFFLSLFVTLFYFFKLLTSPFSNGQSVSGMKFFLLIVLCGSLYTVLIINGRDVVNNPILKKKPKKE